MVTFPYVGAPPQLLPRLSRCCLAGFPTTTNEPGVEKGTDALVDRQVLGVFRNGRVEA